MGCGRVCLYSTLVLAVILAVYLYEPVPPNTANPYKYKIFAATTRVLSDIAHLKSWFTGEDWRITDYEMLESVILAGRHPDPEVQVIEDKFSGVDVYVYKSHSERKDRPGLLYFHGGGFRIGHPAEYESMFYKWVKEMDAVVVGVHYRLAPKHIVPSAFEDCEKATQYFFINAEKYGVDPNLIGAAGDSAGGNLAAALSLMLRDLGENQFAFQVLIYPWVQGLDMQTPSYVRNSDVVMNVMNKEAMTGYLGSYLGVPERLFPDLGVNKHVTQETLAKYEKYLDLNAIPKKSIPSNYRKFEQKNINQHLADFMEKDLTNPYNFPLMADDLTDLPPAFVLTVENDPIRDEGIWYAKRLEQAGNEVVHYNSEDGFHAMIGLQQPPLVFDAAVTATRKMIEFAKQVISDLREDGQQMEKKTISDVKSERTKSNMKANVNAEEKGDLKKELEPEIHDRKQVKDKSAKKEDVKSKVKKPKEDIPEESLHTARPTHRTKEKVKTETDQMPKDSSKITEGKNQKDKSSTAEKGKAKENGNDQKAKKTPNLEPVEESKKNEMNKPEVDIKMDKKQKSSPEPSTKKKETRTTPEPKVEGKDQESRILPEPKIKNKEKEPRSPSEPKLKKKGEVPRKPTEPKIKKKD